MQLPDEAVLRDHVVRYAALIESRGSDFAACPLVLPNARYFPDVFSPDAAGVSRLLQRMQQHAGMSDIPIEVELGVSGAEASSGGSCGSSGGCGDLPAGGSADAGGPGLVALEHGWVLRPNVLQLRHPVALTTLLARMLGAIFIEETRPDQHEDQGPISVTSEVAAVALGFGVLLLEGSHVYSKGCGGPQVARLTELGTAELAALTALFAAHRRHSLGPAIRSASPTQAALLSTAEDWSKSNQQLARSLNLQPSDLLPGDFALHEPNSGAPSLFTWFRSLGKGRGERDLELALSGQASPALAPHAKQNTKPRLASESDRELRALVENALNQAHD